MKKIAKKHNAGFKAKIALEAIKGDHTIPELAAQFGVHPSVIHKWKKIVLEKAAVVFEEGASKTNDELIGKLYKKIGQLEVERDFLAQIPRAN
jgi:transposase-like protein